MLETGENPFHATSLHPFTLPYSLTHVSAVWLNMPSLPATLAIGGCGNEINFNAYLTKGTGRLWSFILLQLCLVSASCVYNVWRFSYCWNGNAQVSACVAAVNACWFKKKSIWWAQASARFKRPSPFLARAKPEVKPMMVEQLAWMPQPVAWLHVYPTKVQTERYWKLFFHEHVTQGLEVANLFPFTNIALSSVLCAFF